MGSGNYLSVGWLTCMHTVQSVLRIQHVLIMNGLFLIDIVTTINRDCGGAKSQVNN